MRLILALLCLAACTPGADVLVSHDAWTGADMLTTPAREIYRDGDALFEVRPVIVVQDGVAAYGVLTNLRRRDANGPKIDRITSLGHTLHYDRHDRLRTHCIDGCQKAEVGVIRLSRDTFAAAAHSGLPLRVWGQRGRYDGTVPAVDFARVLAMTQPG